MDDRTTDQHPTRYEHFPREVAARVTLGAAARALVAPGGTTPSPGACIAITTASGALATRVGLMVFIAAPRADLRADRVPDARPCGLGDLPDRVLGRGTAPSRDRLVLAGDRAVEAWRRWSGAPGASDEVLGVAGALAFAAWCSWGVGSAGRARTRAAYALDIRPDDPVARLVERWCRARIGPTWWAGAPARADGGPTVG